MPSKGYPSGDRRPADGARQVRRRGPGERERAAGLHSPAIARSPPKTTAYRLLTNAHIQAELARRRADIAARNRIKLDDLVQRLKAMAFTYITEVIGSPSSWPEEARAAVKHYEAGPQSSEKVTLHDQAKILGDLWDRLFPDHGGRRTRRRP